jgi:integrase
LTDEDPTAEIRIKIPKTGGFKMWGEPEIEQFENYWPVGTRERLAFALLLYSGQRRGGILRIGRQHIREGILTVRQSKTGTVVVNSRSPQIGGHPGGPRGGQFDFPNNKKWSAVFPRAFYDMVR